MLKHFFGKNKKKDLGSPKSISLCSSVSDSESSLQSDSLQVSADTDDAAVAEAATEASNTTTKPPADEVGEGGEAAAAATTTAAAESASPATVAAAEERRVKEVKDDDSQPEVVESATEATPATMVTERVTETPPHRPGRTTTINTTPGPDDSYEYQEQKERQEAMIRIWRKATTPKKLPFPSRYPGYLKEPPELSYEDTSSSIRRRIYNDTRIKLLQPEPFKRDDSRVVHLSPKSNRAVDLRWKYIRKEPLVSQYFSEHFNNYKKPPFKRTNVKYHN